MTTEPYISIVVPTYNRATLLPLTLHSLFKLNYSNYEVIVVDDGSTDNTLEILSQLQHPNLKIISIVNSERAAARNRGAEQAKGEYINFFDSDDLALPNHLEEAANAINRLNQPEVFHLNYEIRTPENILIKIGRTYRKGETSNDRLMRENPFSCNGVFIRKDIALQHKFNEDRALSVSEDYELWIRLGSRYPLHMVNTVTSVIVLHDNRSVFSVDENKLLHRKNLLLKYAFEDQRVKQEFGTRRRTITAFSDTYISLHLVMSNKIMLGWQYLIKAIFQDPRCLNDRRIPGIIKQSILSIKRKISFKKAA
jgi:glycosyltransferase involved in cell wall biosynthesis